MKRKQKRAFILNECKSPYIAQAIFVLKDGVSEQESGVLADAERIVASYMQERKKFDIKKDSHMLIRLSLGVGAILSVAAIIAVYFIL